MTQKRTVKLDLFPEALGTLAGRQSLTRAAAVLQAGGTVSFATETVYGLGANALDAQAVEGIFLAKQRPAWDPLIVHVSDAVMLECVTSNISRRCQQLIDAFWPGPLTLLLPKSTTIPPIVTAGRTLVGVRMPAHPVAQALIREADVPVAAPSANRFGHTSPTTAQHVIDDLDGRIDLVLDSGPSWCGIESTVMEVTETSAILYRPGAVPVEDIQAIIGPVVLYQTFDIAQDHIAKPESLPSPGVGMRHYAPRAVLITVDVDSGDELLQRKLWLQALHRLSTQKSPGVMLPCGWPLPEDYSGVQYAWGNWQDHAQLAQNLFAGLRALDGMRAEVILCPLPSRNGMGAAIRDRLLYAERKN